MKFCIYTKQYSLFVDYRKGGINMDITLERIIEEMRTQEKK